MHSVKQNKNTSLRGDAVGEETGMGRHYKTAAVLVLRDQAGGL